MAYNEKNILAKTDTSKMTDSEKQLEIKRLERERERVNREIEFILKEYSSEIKDKRLKPRRRKSVLYPNDYGYGDNK